MRTKCTSLFFLNMSNNWRDDSFERLEYGGGSQKKPPQKPQQQTHVGGILQKLAEQGGFATQQTDSEAQKIAEALGDTEVSKLKQDAQIKDNPQLEEIRKKLHYLKLQQSGTQKAIEERREEEAERKREDEEDNLAKDAEKKQSLTPLEMPKGKERKSIFGGKKKVEQSQAEFKPGSSKF